MKLYAERDIVAQGEFYTRHVSAMTSEGLHQKSDIAAELAHRDERIAVLEAFVQAFDVWDRTGLTTAGVAPEATAWDVVMLKRKALEGRV